MNGSTAGMRDPFLSQLGQFDVLSRREERRLFRRLRAAQSTVRPVPNATATNPRAVAIRNRIIESNLRLVISLAARFTRSGQPLDELVSRAALILLRCVERFDPTRGTKFSTYATRALVHHFSKCARRAVRVAGRENLAQAAGGGRGADALEKIIRFEDLRRLRECLDQLSDRERSLVAGRFGLTADRHPRTFRELGRLHGLSKERVRVITGEALRRLRRRFES